MKDLIEVGTVVIRKVEFKNENNISYHFIISWKAACSINKL